MKCSVIIPAYNAEKYIQRSVVSALSQSLKELEVIVVDDGSTDKTYSILSQLARRDPRLRLIRHARNRGAPCARNTALEVAQGEWVAFLDADDWMDEERLERLIMLAKRWKADMIADDVYLIAPSQYEAVIERKRADHIHTLFNKRFKKTLPRFIAPDEFIKGNMPGPRNLRLGLIKPIFRHSFIRKNSLRWNEKVLVSQDMVFYLDCLIHNAKLLLIPEADYYYLEGRPQSISATVPKLKGNIHRYKINEYLIGKYSWYNPKVKKALLKRKRRLINVIRHNLFVYKIRKNKVLTFVKILISNFRIFLSYSCIEFEKYFYRYLFKIKGKFNFYKFLD